MTENDAIAKFKRTSVLWESATNTEMVEAVKVAIQALEEIQQYRAIGTIEELKALKEKNTPYKPQEYEDRYYACKCDNILLPKWRKYPTELMPKTEGLPHCMACGQKLDWSE